MLLVNVRLSVGYVDLVHAASTQIRTTFFFAGEACPKTRSHLDSCLLTDRTYQIFGPELFFRHVFFIILVSPIKVYSLSIGKNRLRSELINFDDETRLRWTENWQLWTVYLNIDFSVLSSRFQTRTVSK